MFLTDFIKERGSQFHLYVCDACLSAIISRLTETTLMRFTEKYELYLEATSKLSFSQFLVSLNHKGVPKYSYNNRI